MTAKRTRARERPSRRCTRSTSPPRASTTPLGRFWKSFEPVEREVMDLAEALVRGVAEHRARVDDEIERVSSNWRLDRMAKVDRNVLRLAVYELLGRTCR